MSRRIIRLNVTVDHRLSAVVAIEDDGTSTDAIGNWNVTMDDLGRKSQTKAHIAGWDRHDRTGVELISEAFRVLAEAEREAAIP